MVNEKNNQVVKLLNLPMVMDICQGIPIKKIIYQMDGLQRYDDILINVLPKSVSSKIRTLDYFNPCTVDS
jgi:hypothetical protein